MAGGRDPLDQVEDDAVRVVLRPADRVVLERDAARRDLGVELPVRVAVEVGEGDPVRRGAGGLQQVDDLVGRRPDLGVDEDRGAGRGGGAADRLEPAPLGAADVVVRRTALDRARPAPRSSGSDGSSQSRGCMPDA